MMKISSAIILITLLQQISYCQNFYKAEVYLSARDYHNGGVIIDSVKKQYTDVRGYLNFKTVSGKVFSYNTESIWGYQGYGPTYRYWDDATKWGANDWWVEIMCEHGIIIYSIGGGYRGGQYYFSKTIDSEIYPLNRRMVKKIFKDDKVFLDALSKELKWYQYWDKDKATYEYKINQIYKKCKS